MVCPKNRGKRLVNQRERELKQVAKCLRLRLTWCNRNGQTYDPSYKQYSLYPRAICDEAGNPHRGSKALWTDKLEKRYAKQTCECIPVMHILRNEWIAEVAILDAMFLILHYMTITDYAKHLFNRFMTQYYNAGVTYFLMLGQFNPKVYEQKRREKSSGNDHEHIKFQNVPKAWRTCIIEAIGLSYMQTARFRQHQRLVLAGSENNTPVVIAGDGSLPTADPTYKSCAIEADMRIWRHVAVVRAQTVLPDTDVYNIGLAVAHSCPQKEVIVQINVAHSRELRYVHIRNMLKALESDPDIARLPQSYIAAIFHMLFVVSGCDYIFYFSGFGKGTFLNTFYQHAEFISGNHSGGPYFRR